MKKILTIILVLLLGSVNVGFTYYDGIGNVYWDSKKDIYKGIKYREQVAIKNGSEQQVAKFVEAEIDQKDIVPLVISGDIGKSYTLDDMIKKAEDEGYKVVVAINADVFDMPTSAPKGLVIHNGEILCSGFKSEQILVFDYENKAKLITSKPKFTLKGFRTVKVKKLVETENMENYDEFESEIDDGSDNQDLENSKNEEEDYTIEERDFESEISFINIPYGGAKALHLFTDNYGATTKTQGNCVEVVIETENHEDSELRVNKNIRGIIKEVKVNTSNTKIEEDQIILSSIYGTKSAENLSNMVVGSEVEIIIEDTENNDFENIKESVGIFYSILKDGEIDTYGSRKNPRTAFGIKDDGSLVLYTLDGRRNTAKGLCLPELAKHMRSLGCVDAFNLDGGGSTAIYTRIPGKNDTPVLRNKPSGNIERKVTNAIVLAYREEGSGNVENISIYPSLSLVMCGGEVKLEAFGSNDKFEKKEIYRNHRYKIEEGSGSIDDDGNFKAGNIQEKVIISCESGSAKGMTEVQVLKDNLNIKPNFDKIKAELNQEFDINMSVKYGPMNVISKDNLFIWNCDENIGKIDENGLFKAVDKDGQKGKIYVSFDKYKIEIPVSVGKDIIDFEDTKKHWAREFIGSLAVRKIVNGVGENLYQPDNKLTRAQFLALLSKMSGNVIVDSEVSMKFEDVPEDEWYYNYVKWGYEQGIVNGVTENLFMPNDSINREQMCTMLSKYAKKNNVVLPKTKENVEFTDAEKISDWAKEYIYENAYAGIVNGMPDGSFNPTGLATRAESAKIGYVFLEIKEGNNKSTLQN